MYYIFIFFMFFASFAFSKSNNTDRIVIKLKYPLSHSVVSQKLSKKSLYIPSKINLSNFGDDFYIIKLDKRKSLDEIKNIIDEIKGEFDYEYIEPDKIAWPTVVSPNDSWYSWQWHYKSTSTEIGGVNLPQAWDITTGSTSTVVAVIDTGILPHEDLSSSRILSGYDMIPDASNARDGDGYDSNPRDEGSWLSASDPDCGDGNTYNSSWHGLHVTGTIAADTNNSTGVAGINWKTKILPVRVLGKCGGYDSDIANAIRWAAGGSVSGVPINPNPARVINLSLSGEGSCSTTLQDAINFAVSQGAVVVVAAGNKNSNASSYWPGNCSGVVTVAAIDRSANRASYSNYGSIVYISAPGGDSINPVYSTLNGGTTTPLPSPTYDTYNGYYGTSMATPHVSGIISLMLGLKPTLTRTEILYNLIKTARSFPAGSTCNTSICGYGIINANAALDNLIISITSSTPNSAINAQNISLSVFGKGFLTGSVVKLKRAGYSDVICNNVNVINLNQINCTMPISGVDAGLWDLYVYNQDNSFSYLSSYFSISSLTISGISPSTGYNDLSSNINVSINGTGFINTSSTVRLTKTGYPDLNCVNVVVNSSTNITCSLLVLGAFSGKRDLVLTNGSGRTVTITDGFEILNANPSVNQIIPSSGYNNSSISVFIYGKGFSPSATAKLSKTGFNDISCSMSVLSSTACLCSFNLNGEWEGTRDFVVYSGTNTITKSDFFTVNSAALSILSMVPFSGYNNNSSINTTIYGSGFKPSLSLKLSKLPYSDIIPSSFEVKSSTHITAIFNISNVPAGKRDLCITQTSVVCKTDAFNIMDILGLPYINYIIPESAFNNQNPIISIYGDNFIDGTIIKLVRSGFSDIDLTDFDVISSTFIANALLPLKDKTPGSWAIRVINPNLREFTYYSFNLLEFKKEETVKIYNPVLTPNSDGVSITYNLNSNYSVNITIYDNKGKRVRELYKGVGVKDLNQIKWDGKDDSGRKLGAGIYVIKIETPQYTEYKRAVIVK